MCPVNMFEEQYVTTRICSKNCMYTRVASYPKYISLIVNLFITLFMTAVVLESLGEKK